MERMQSPGTQTFFRGTDRILGGVCSGLAEGFHVEVLWVRLAFVVLTFINGVGLLLYVVLWVLMPERTGYRPPGQNAFESMGADIKRAWGDLRTQFGSGPAAPAAPAAPATAATAETAASAPPAAGIAGHDRGCRSNAGTPGRPSTDYA
jgi:phage shock protein PspC (stress-responsive transcriptional regulator)